MTTALGEQRIQRLPALLVNQIAAGEVIERPASVVKELVDNALDAGATRIVIELEQGGIELVRVTDDGSGIPEMDLALAIAPHATSKIKAAEDLDRIATMGFRGEALASITSVARVGIRSRTIAQPGAIMLEAEGDTTGQARPCAGPVGTSVTVRNLFFNTPARRKFLRTVATEQNACVDVAQSLALSHPGVGFEVRCDGRVSLDVHGSQSPKERVLAVLGKELAAELIEVHSDGSAGERGVVLWGLIGRPSIARATAKHQFVFVNGRPIRDKTIQHALREAYRGLIEPGRYPTAVLVIDMDPATVDVNVHPAKIEVRFRDQSLMHSLVLRSVRDALRSADLTPDVHGFGAGSGIGPGLAAARAGGGGLVGGGFTLRSSWSDMGPGRLGAGGAGAWGTGGTGGMGTGEAAGARPGVLAYARQAFPAGGQSPYSYNAVREAMRSATGLDVGDAPAAAGAVDQAPTEVQAGQPSPGTPGGETDSAARAMTLHPPEQVMQIHKSFVVTQDEQGLVIVDQHALHERIMFEALIARIGSGDLESQRLLTPVVVRATARQVEHLDDLAMLLKRLGIEVRPLSAEDVGIHAFPTFLFDKGVDAGEFVAEILERSEQEGFAPQSEEALHEVIDMMSCKAAVKAGDRMTEGELRDLMKLRELVERASNCPHGRPTTVRLTIRELERLFGRS